MNVDDSLLLAMLAGALEPGQSLELREEIAASSALQDRLAVLSARLQQAAQTGARWDIPLPGVSAGVNPFLATVSDAMVMGRTPLQPGDRFTVDLEVDPSTLHSTVVVLLERAGRWNVLFPKGPEQMLRVHELPQQDDGRRRLELVAQEGTGTQRWAMALAPDGWVIDWRLDPSERWWALEEALGRGEIPVCSWIVRVE